MAYTIFTRGIVTEEQFRAVHATARTEREAAKRIGIDRATYLKYARSLGLEPKPAHRHKAMGLERLRCTQYGPVYKWLTDHPGSRLPRSPMAASALTGLPVSIIRSFMKRRNVALRKFVLSYGDLRGFNATIDTDTGLRVPCRTVTRYGVAADAREMRVTLLLWLGTRDAPLRATFGVYSFDEWARRALADTSIGS